MATSTPWGKSQSSRRIARGIVEYSTASHGGIHLSRGRLAALPDEFRAFRTWAGPGWYEEDCDWSIVALAFPAEYCAGMDEAQKARVLAGARQTFDRMVASRGAENARA